LHRDIDSPVLPLKDRTRRPHRCNGGQTLPGNWREGEAERLTMGRTKSRCKKRIDNGLHDVHQRRSDRGKTADRGDCNSTFTDEELSEKGHDTGQASTKEQTEQRHINTPDEI
jgi:hypothetical protein